MNNYLNIKKYFKALLKLILKDYSFTKRLVIIIKNLINLNFYKNLSKKQKAKELGLSELKLNYFNYDELMIINNNNYFPEHMVSLRSLIEPKSIFFLYKVKTSLYAPFIYETLKKELKTYQSNINNLSLYDLSNSNFIIDDENEFFELIKNNREKNIILITEEKIPEKFIEYLNNIKIILAKEKIIFKEINKMFNYFYDKFGKIHLNKTEFHNYFLYSKDKIINESEKNLLSGIGLLKDLDLYPFDICFESVLLFVDEFILGIDESVFDKKNELILNNFLNQTKYKDKIKLKFFNFNSETTLNCFTRGRWIADVANKLINYSSSKYILKVDADELFDININNEVKNNLDQKYNLINYKYYHFIYDLNSIRDPKNPYTYNRANKIFEKNNFNCHRDGLAFLNVTNKKMKKLNSENCIYHIGYLLDYERKIKKHLGKDGLFSNQFDEDAYKKTMQPVEVEKKVLNSLRNTLENYNYLDNYKRIKQFF